MNGWLIALITLSSIAVYLGIGVVVAALARYCEIDEKNTKGEMICRLIIFLWPIVTLIWGGALLIFALCEVGQLAVNKLSHLSSELATLWTNKYKRQT